jgi:hypothetical protein
MREILAGAVGDKMVMGGIPNAQEPSIPRLKTGHYSLE